MTNMNDIIICMSHRSFLYNHCIDNGVTAFGFSQLDEEDFEDLGLTKIGKKLILKILPEIKIVPS